MGDWGIRVWGLAFAAPQASIARSADSRNRTPQAETPAGRRHREAKVRELTHFPQKITPIQLFQPNRGAPSLIS